MTIRKLLTPQQIDYIDRMRAEMHRLYALSDKELGEEILRLCQSARSQYPQETTRGEPHRDTYTTALFWDVGPEVARRLGATIAEDVRADVRKTTDRELRYWVGSCIAGTPWSPITGKKEEYLPLCPWDILAHEVVNGNPLAFAVDRLAPVTELDRDDRLCRAMNEVSHARGFEPPLLMWTPVMDSDPKPREAAKLLLKADAPEDAPAFTV